MPQESGLKNMRKIFKVIIAVFAIFIIAVAAFGAIVFLDLSAYVAGGASQMLLPSGASAGTALVVYDPGLSGAAKGVAEKVASELQVKGYTVTLAGIKSSDATHVLGAKIVVAGGPVYAGALTGSVKDFLNSLSPDSGAKVGVFGSGSGAQEDMDLANMRSSVAALSEGGSLQNAVVVKIGQSEDVTARTQAFVDQLTAS